MKKIAFMVMVLCYGIIWGEDQILTQHAVIRNFDGYIEKLGLWDRLSLRWQKYSDIQYGLFKDGKCIAYLLGKQGDAYMVEKFSQMNKMQVVLKGHPQYINKEPYLLITVEDVCKQ